MKTVTSKDNPVLKAAAKLRTRKGREEAGAFLVEGKKMISEAANAGFATERVFINAGALARGDVKAGECAKEIALARGDVKAGEYANEIALAENLFVGLAENLFVGLAGTRTPQPYIAVVKRQGDGSSVFSKTEEPSPCLKTKEPSPCLRALVLDRVGDPGNVGAMMRSALAAGFDALWCTKGTADVFSDKAVRASAGAIFRLPVLEGLSAEDCVGLAKDAGARLFTCRAGGTDIYETDLKGGIVLVIGNEGAGPQEVFLKEADGVIGIPMAGGAESLNAAAAAAIVMYEAGRQARAER